MQWQYMYVLVPGGDIKINFKFFLGLGSNFYQLMPMNSKVYNIKIPGGLNTLSFHA